MSEMSSRKTDHIDLAIHGDVAFRSGTLLDQVRLLHCSLPEINLDAIDLSAQLFGKTLKAPLVIAAMTGGTDRAGEINRQLAEVAARGGYALGLGSQRAMIKTGEINSGVAESYQLREIGAQVPIFGNLGAVQAAQMSTEQVNEMLEYVGASALCVHLNPAQEMIQPGGDRDFRGCLAAIERLCSELKYPVIVKETGCGISRPVAMKLHRVGVRNLDLSGAGGTSWVGVEARRAHGDAIRQGELFWDWGIPTAASILQVSSLPFDQVIATGGIKNGLEVAKALSLGATLAGIARPVLQALDQGGVDGALTFLKSVESDLRTAMLLTGTANLRALQDVPKHLGAELESWR